MNRTTVARMMLLEAARVFVQANPMRGDFISDDDPSLHALESAAVMLALGKEADAREKRGATGNTEDLPILHTDGAPPKEKKPRKPRKPKSNAVAAEEGARSMFPAIDAPPMPEYAYDATTGEAE